MLYPSTFTPSTENHEFKRYQDLIRYAASHNCPEIVAEYKRLIEFGAQVPLYGCPSVRKYKNHFNYRTHDDFVRYSRCHKYATCMDVAKDKGSCIKVPTLEGCPAHDYVRFPQGFDPFSVIAPVNIFDIWKKYSDYKQVSAGISHMFRDVIIVDIDNKDNSMNLFKILSVVQEKKLPSPNYIITHHKEGLDTFQLGFHMETLQVKHCDGTDFIPARYGKGTNYSKYYILMVHEMNKIFNGDIHFTGWQCKNPFYCQNDSEFSVNWYHEDVNRWIDIRMKLGINFEDEPPLPPDSNDPNGRPRKRKSTISECHPDYNRNCAKTAQVPKSGVYNSLSRNGQLIQYIAKLVRQSKNTLNEEQVLTKCIEDSYLFSYGISHSAPLSRSEIASTVHSSFRHFSSTYKKPEGPHYSSESRACSALKRSFNKMIDSLSVYNLESLGLSRSEICSQAHLSLSHFNRYHVSEDALRARAQSLLDGFNSTLKFFSESNSNHGFWLKAIHELSELLSSFSPASAGLFVSHFPQKDSSKKSSRLAA